MLDNFEKDSALDLEIRMNLKHLFPGATILKSYVC